MNSNMEQSTILNVQFTLTRAAVVIDGNTWIFSFDDRESSLPTFALCEKYKKDPDTLIATFDLLDVTDRADKLPYRPFNVVVSAAKPLIGLTEVERKELFTALLYRMRGEMEMFLNQLQFINSRPQFTKARMLDSYGKALATIPHSFFLSNPFAAKAAANF